MFGWLAGIIIAALCYLQVIYSAGLWILSLPLLLNMHQNLTIPRLNPFVYGCFSFIVIGLGLLVVANFFISRYKSAWELFGENYMTATLVFIAILIMGNLSRVGIMSKLTKR